MTQDQQLPPEKYKWNAIERMWGGLGFFLVIMAVLVYFYFASVHEHDVEKAKINACSHSTNVVACIKAVK